MYPDYNFSGKVICLGFIIILVILVLAYWNRRRVRNGRDSIFDRRFMGRSGFMNRRRGRDTMPSTDVEAQPVAAESRSDRPAAAAATAEPLPLYTERANPAQDAGYYNPDGSFVPAANKENDEPEQAPPPIDEMQETPSNPPYYYEYSAPEEPPATHAATHRINHQATTGAH